MSQIFLGKWWHWLIMVVLCGLFWQAGKLKMHVIEFNSFVLLLLAATIAILIAIIYTTRPGQKITREELQPPEES